MGPSGRSSAVEWGSALTGDSTTAAGTSSGEATRTSWEAVTGDVGGLSSSDCSTVGAMASADATFAFWRGRSSISLGVRRRSALSRAREGVSLLRSLDLRLGRGSGDAGGVSALPRFLPAASFGHWAELTPRLGCFVSTLSRKGGDVSHRAVRK